MKPSLYSAFNSPAAAVKNNFSSDYTCNWVSECVCLPGIFHMNSSRWKKEVKHCNFLNQCNVLFYEKNLNALKALRIVCIQYCWDEQMIDILVTMRVIKQLSIQHQTSSVTADATITITAPYLQRVSKRKKIHWILTYQLLLGDNL